MQRFTASTSESTKFSMCHLLQQTLKTSSLFLYLTWASKLMKPLTQTSVQGCSSRFNGSIHSLPRTAPHALQLWLVFWSRATFLRKFESSFPAVLHLFLLAGRCKVTHSKGCLHEWILKPLGCFHRGSQNVLHCILFQVILPFKTKKKSLNHSFCFSYFYFFYFASLSLEYHLGYLNKSMKFIALHNTYTTYSRGVKLFFNEGHMSVMVTLKGAVAINFDVSHLTSTKEEKFLIS